MGGEVEASRSELGGLRMDIRLRAAVVPPEASPSAVPTPLGHPA